MNDYIEVRIDVTPCNEDVTDCLAYMLAEIGYESFVPDETGVSAYIQESLYDADTLAKTLSELPFNNSSLTYKATKIEGQDWNEEWERNYFKPITVDSRVVVHSTFHTDVPEAEFDIVIDPKMAFGTGHHATTTLMIRRLLSEDISDKFVIDMGTGTGILAILAAMRGATKVVAIEIDEFACVNAAENLSLNKVEKIVDLKLGDAAQLANIDGAQYFLANINRNIITADLPAYWASIAHQGTLLLSGFYEEDVPIVRKAAEELGFEYADHTVLDRWACVKLIKK